MQIPKFFYCRYCGYYNKEPEPPTYNTYNTAQTYNYNTYQNPEPARIDRLDPKTGQVTYRDEVVHTPFTSKVFVFLAVVGFFEGFLFYSLIGLWTVLLAFANAIMIAVLATERFEGKKTWTRFVSAILVLVIPIVGLVVAAVVFTITALKWRCK